MLIQKMVILIALAFFLFIAGAGAFAQNQNLPQSDEIQQNDAISVENESVETQESSSTSNGTAIPEVFNPSEEIVEDTAVSFPVDI